MTKISELRTGQGNVNVKGIVKEMGEARSFNKYGRQLVVANAMLEDESGSIKLSLWNDDASRIKQGDEVEIENGYVSEFQGEKQLTSGKFGKIKKVGSAESSDSDEDSEEEESAESSSEDSSEESSSEDSSEKKIEEEEF